MLVDLKKKDLVRLICGVSPRYEKMDDRYGSYTGGFVDDWKWNSNTLSKLTEDKLWELYVWLNEPPPPSEYKLRLEKEIEEIKDIIQDGINRNNKGQELSAKLELERLEKLLKTAH